MATRMPTTPVDHTGHGGEPPVPPTGGGDEGHSGQGPNYSARLHRARLGLICTMVAVTMMFMSLTGVYVFRKAADTPTNPTTEYVRTWGVVNLPWALLGFNTFLLLLSSSTMERARRHLAMQSALAPVRSIPGIALEEESSFPWLGATVVLGFGFLLGQWMAWRQLQHGGFYLNTNPYSSFVYLLTAIHGLHLAGGIVALLFVQVGTVKKRPIEARRILLEVTSWYWHFMAILWVYVFFLLAIGK